LDFETHDYTLTTHMRTSESGERDKIPPAS
jgi:hypothetical protein